MKDASIEAGAETIADHVVLSAGGQTNSTASGGAVVGGSFDLHVPTQMLFVCTALVERMQGNVGHCIELMQTDSGAPDAPPRYYPISYASIHRGGLFEGKSDSRTSALLLLPKGTYQWRSSVYFSEALGRVQQSGNADIAQGTPPVHMYCRGSGEMYSVVSGSGDQPRIAMASQQIDFGQSMGTLKLKLSIQNQTTRKIQDTPLVENTSLGEPKITTNALQFFLQGGERMMVEAYAEADRTVWHGLRILDINPRNA